MVTPRQRFASLVDRCERCMFVEHDEPEDLGPAGHTRVIERKVEPPDSVEGTILESLRKDAASLSFLKDQGLIWHRHDKDMLERLRSNLHMVKVWAASAALSEEKAIQFIMLIILARGNVEDGGALDTITTTIEVAKEMRALAQRMLKLIERVEHREGELLLFYSVQDRRPDGTLRVRHPFHEPTEPFEETDGVSWLRFTECYLEHIIGGKSQRLSEVQRIVGHKVKASPHTPHVR